MRPTIVSQSSAASRPSRRVDTRDGRNRRGVLLAVVLTVAFGVVGCAPEAVVWGSGRTAIETRSVRDFISIAVHGGGEVTLRQTADESLVVEAEESILPYLASRVERGRLTIGPSEGAVIRPTKPIKYRVTVKDLRQLLVDGSATVDVRGIETGTFDALVRGTAAVTVAGRASRQEIRVLESATVDARHLVGQRATVAVSDLAAAQVNVSDRIDASADGDGQITYLGAPQVAGTVLGGGAITAAP